MKKKFNENPIKISTEFFLNFLKLYLLILKFIWKRSLMKIAKAMHSSPGGACEWEQSIQGASYKGALPVEKFLKK